MTHTNDNQPSLAARAFREVKAQTVLRGEASASAIFEATRTALGLPEEQCGGEILDAICLAVRQGLVECNTYDRAENSVLIGQRTILAPAFPAMH